MTDDDEPSERHRVLLERVLTGELSLEDEAVQRALRGDPSLAAELEALTRLTGQLDDLGAQGHTDSIDDGDQLPRATVERLLDEHLPPSPGLAPRPSSGRTTWPRSLLAAAAALLLLGGAAGGWWMFRADDRPPPVTPDTVLGANELWPARSDSPLAFDEFVRLGFRWGTLDLRPGDRLAVLFTTDDPAAAPERIPVTVPTDGAPPTSVAVPPALQASRPKQLSWTLERNRVGARPERWHATVRFQR